MVAQTSKKMINLFGRPKFGYSDLWTGINMDQLFSFRDRLAIRLWDSFPKNGQSSLTFKGTFWKTHIVFSLIQSWFWLMQILLNFEFEKSWPLPLIDLLLTSSRNWKVGIYDIDTVFLIKPKNSIAADRQPVATFQEVRFRAPGLGMGRGNSGPARPADFSPRPGLPWKARPGIF